MPDPTPDTFEQLSASDIADLAGVSPSAVSNWRKRYRDFPQPIEHSGRWLRYRSDQVRTWLETHGRMTKLPTDCQSLTDELERAATGLQEHLPFTKALLVAAGVHATFVEPEDVELLARVRQLGVGDLAGSDLAQMVVVEHELVAESYQEIAESVVEVLNTRGGRLVEESVTSPELCEFLAALNTPLEAEEAFRNVTNPVVYDPCAGLGGTLLAVGGQYPDAHLIGQELNPDYANLAELLLVLNGYSPQILAGDSLTFDGHPGLKADIGVAHPPLGVRLAAGMGDDPRWLLGDPKGDGANGWIQILIDHLKVTGRATLIVENAWAHRPSSRDIRAALVRQNYLDAVISVPRGTFPGLTADSLVVVVDRARAHDDTPVPLGEVFFLEGFPTDEILGPQVFTALLAVYRDWRVRNATGESSLSAVTTYDQIAECGFDLTPARHVPHHRDVRDVDVVIKELIGQLENTTMDGNEFVKALSRYHENAVPAHFVPSGFRTVRLGDLVDRELLVITEGVSEQYEAFDPGDRSKTPVLREEWLEWGAWSEGSIYYDVLARERTKRDPTTKMEDVVIGLTGDVLGNARLVDYECDWFLDQGLAALTLVPNEDRHYPEGLYPAYLELWFNSTDCADQIRRLYKAGPRRRLDITALEELVVSIPAGDSYDTLARRLEALHEARIWVGGIKRFVDRVPEREAEILDALLNQYQ